jgi:putative spermidine/putrescine transport system permease protein
MRAQLRPFLLLTPTLAVILLLFGGGVLLALLQSVGYLPFLGSNKITLDAYRTIFQQPAFWQSLLLTVWVALVSTAVSTLLALICALALRRPFRSHRLVTFIFQLNIPIPHLVGAVGILFLFSQSGFLARLADLAGLITEPADFPIIVFDRWAIGIILEYVWKTTCFTGLILLAALQSVGNDLETAAQNLGASRWQRFRFVILPLLTPSMVSASVLVFAFTFGAFEVPLVLGQRFPSMLPVLAYRSYVDVDLNARPEAMAMNVIITLLIGVLIFIYMRLTDQTLRREG